MDLRLKVESNMTYRNPTMMETVLKLYSTSMAGDIRSPMPHLFGPPGCGKSTIVATVAKLAGVQMHTINVSRISPLELEGIQMPVDGNSKLKLLTATFWTQLKEGDILLLDEFLRGFPEVYNGLLDILTAREVAGYKLPKVFIIGASNSVVSYDPALEDRLLHIPAIDPRKYKTEDRNLRSRLIDALGLNPKIKDSTEMEQLMQTEVFPTFQILDQLKNHSTVAGSSLEGHSLRNLIGQAQLREVQSTALKELIQVNNLRSMRDGAVQYVFLLDGTFAPSGYEEKAKRLLEDKSALKKMSPVQVQNLQLNLQLIELDSIRKEEVQHDDTADDDGIFAV